MFSKLPTNYINSQHLQDGLKSVKGGISVIHVYNKLTALMVLVRNKNLQLVYTIMINYFDPIPVAGASPARRYILSIELLELELEDDWALPGRGLRRGDFERLTFQGTGFGCDKPFDGGGCVLELFVCRSEVIA